MELVPQKFTGTWNIEPVMYRHIESDVFNQAIKSRGRLELEGVKNCLVPAQAYAHMHKIFLNYRVECFRLYIFRNTHFSSVS